MEQVIIMVIMAKSEPPPQASRRALRRAVDLECEIISERLGDEPISGQATDLTAYGMAVLTDAPLQLGEPVVVGFVPPHAGKKLTVFAEVSRLGHASGKRGLGLKFCNLTIWEHQVLHSAVKGLPPVLPDKRLSPDGSIE